MFLTSDLTVFFYCFQTENIIPTSFVGFPNVGARSSRSSRQLFFCLESSLLKVKTRENHKTPETLSLYCDCTMRDIAVCETSGPSLTANLRGATQIFPPKMASRGFKPIVSVIFMVSQGP